MSGKQTHLPEPNNFGLIDLVKCSCGWISSDYWDGMEYALDEWKLHQAEKLEGK